jgi:hypothetical protein
MDKKPKKYRLVRRKNSDEEYSNEFLQRRAEKLGYKKRKSDTDDNIFASMSIRDMIMKAEDLDRKDNDFKHESKILDKDIDHPLS